MGRGPSSELGLSNANTPRAIDALVLAPALRIAAELAQMPRLASKQMLLPMQAAEEKLCGSIITMNRPMGARESGR